MKTVYLTSGPRGSGKSSYVKKVLTHYPDVIEVSRDKILIELFGKVSLDLYCGGHYYAAQVVFEKLGEHLSKDKDMRIILDYWNGFSRERKNMIHKLRDLGANEVNCLFFKLPVDTCVKWFMSKPESRGFGESGQRDDYELYYLEARSINEDGFDKVIQIDPLKPFSALQ